MEKEAKKTLEKEEKLGLTMKELLENGVHFGHKKSNRNPKMDPYLFGEKKGISIIDLKETTKKIQQALSFIEDLNNKEGKIVLVGTKKQAKSLVKKVAENLKIPYVNERWIGGTFTNFKVVLKRLEYLKKNREALEKNQLSHLTKLEKGRLNKELKNLEEKMGGLVDMTRLPEAVFVLDIDKDRNAVKEAQKKGIKAIALVDSNDNPEGLDYPIPANNDALSSLTYILSIFAQGFKKNKKVK